MKSYEVFSSLFLLSLQHLHSDGGLLIWRDGPVRTQIRFAEGGTLKEYVYYVKCVKCRIFIHFYLDHTVLDSFLILFMAF